MRLLLGVYPVPTFTRNFEYSFLFHFCHGIYLIVSWPFFFVSLLVVTQILGHIVASLPHSPVRYVPCVFRRPSFLCTSVLIDVGAHAAHAAHAAHGAHELPLSDGKRNTRTPFFFFK